MKINYNKVNKCLTSPNHVKGISPVRGLYYIGLPWQSQRGSALICGVGKDAAYLLSEIKKIDQ
ncbi:Uncharacterized oxidoreductase CzcO [Streptococcus pneumoniae]|nr:Uncharacterized oxidoreductase CzcO [Streptococcus pneumoniae]